MDYQVKSLCRRKMD